MLCGAFDSPLYWVLRCLTRKKVWFGLRARFAILLFPLILRLRHIYKLTRSWLQEFDNRSMFLYLVLIFLILRLKLIIFKVRTTINLVFKIFLGLFIFGCCLLCNLFFWLVYLLFFLTTGCWLCIIFTSWFCRFFRFLFILLLLLIIFFWCCCLRWLAIINRFSFLFFRWLSWNIQGLIIVYGGFWLSRRFCNLW